MKKAKNKLPSGSYRVQVFDYKDESGKKHYKSFTAPTRQEAEFMAMQWRNGHTEKKKASLTVRDAVDKYIEIKHGVLSPSTLRGYDAIARNRLNGIGNTPICDLDQTEFQIWISDLAEEYSSKYVRNVYGLVNAAIEMFAPEVSMHITLPAKERPDLYCPSDDDIKALLDEVRDTELELAVLLAAFGPLRRGEICALDSDDIHGNIISVTKSKVKGDDGLWHIKQPKTFGSYREIEFPSFVVNKFKGMKGPLFQLDPDQISSRFRHAVVRAGLPHFRFHDLRHYSASIMHAIGVPDQYILQRGGWISDNIMKTVYRNTIDTETAKQTKKINEHFAQIAG